MATKKQQPQEQQSTFVAIGYTRFQVQKALEMVFTEEYNAVIRFLCIKLDFRVDQPAVVDFIRRVSHFMLRVNADHPTMVAK